MKKPTILAFSAGYLPSDRWGGSVRSIANLVELLGDEFDFWIITGDHDLGAHKPYKGITPNRWVAIGKAEVYYASKSGLRFSSLIRIMGSVAYDVLYLNSFFSVDFTVKPLLLRRLNLVPAVGTIIAPRGEFSSGALCLKRVKKHLFIALTRVVGLYKDVWWQASSGFEAADIQKIIKLPEFPTSSRMITAPDLAIMEFESSRRAATEKESGKLDIIFVSRLSPKKNLDGALSMLKGIEGNITFNVYGPVEDQRYFQECQALCADLADNIKVVFHGEIEHARVHDIFRSSHLFFFPTHGENFGHVILEAMCAGCPVLLSDQTPWKGLNVIGVGWDIPLNRPEEFRAVLERFVAMDAGEFRGISERTMAFGKKTLGDPLTVKQNLDLFHTVINGIKTTAS